MIRFGKDIDLSLTGKHLPKHYHSDLTKQNDRARGLWERLYKRNHPGVLLADEVGKGKTYVALAVALSVLVSKNNKGRVLVLTHSGTMARIWQERWAETWDKCLTETGKKKTDKISWEARSYKSIDKFTDDARNGNLPPISFASYETLKKYGSEEHSAGLLYAALKRSKKNIKIQFDQNEVRALIKDIVDCDLRSIRHAKIKHADVLCILKNIDRNERWWKEDAYSKVENILDRMQARRKLPKMRFDLLIIDEAHKLEGSARHRVVSRLLHKRYGKSILVTATPFALSVGQFRNRLLDFRYCHGIDPDFENSIRKIPFEEFRRAVASGDDYSAKESLEKQLRGYMVRETWDHAKERATSHWEYDSTAETIMPTLILERLIDGVLQSGLKTHIASRRESLCSSWPAARKSMEKSPLKGGEYDWGLAFDAVVKGKAALEDPKLKNTAKNIVKLIQEGIKVVVFTQRKETSKALKALIDEHPTVVNASKEMVKHQNRLVRHQAKIADWIGLSPEQAFGVIKVMAHSSDRPAIEKFEVVKWWKSHDKQVGSRVKQDWTSMRSIIGKARRLPIAVRYPADSGADENNIDKFNLPSSPLVLITTPKAQEGIDLHHYCHHVVLFDLTWNPAVMEQRIGRVHRIGGSRRPNEKVEVYYCYQKGTYEDVMAKRVQTRCEMMRVLLGAGQWLDQGREVRELDKYMMTFPA